MIRYKSFSCVKEIVEAAAPAGTQHEEKIANIVVSSVHVFNPVGKAVVERRVVLITQTCSLHEQHQSMAGGKRASKRSAMRRIEAHQLLPPALSFHHANRPIRTAYGMPSVKHIDVLAARYPDMLRRTIILVFAALVVTPVPAAQGVTYAQRRVASTEAPYVVSVYINQNPGVFDPSLVCTGTLIDSRFVLTAAHCLAGYSPEQLLIGAGGTSLADSLLYAAASLTVHPGYREPPTLDTGLLDDIGLIRLTEPVAGITPLAVTPPKDASLLNNPKGMALYGWGFDENGQVDDRLGYTKQRNYSSTASRWYDGFNPRKQVAAGFAIKRRAAFAGPCTGDSGGPLVGFNSKRMPFIVGVVSYGASDCLAGVPAVYTRVSAYRAWIKRTKAEMIARAGAVALTYQVSDALGDAASSGGAYADITRVASTSTPEKFNVSVLLDRRDALTGYRLSLQLVSPNSTTVLLTVTDQGVVRATDGALVCPVEVSTQQEQTNGPLYSYDVASDCIVTYAGVTFDVIIEVAQALGDPATASDVALLEGVNLILR